MCLQPLILLSTGIFQSRNNASRWYIYPFYSPCLTRGLSYLQRLSEIWARICNQRVCLMWNWITHPFPNYKGCLRNSNLTLYDKMFVHLLPNCDDRECYHDIWYNARDDTYEKWYKLYLMKRLKVVFKYDNIKIRQMLLLPSRLGWLVPISWYNSLQTDY